MVTELIVIWAVGVVAFFALWAVLLKVIKRIGERKQKEKTNHEYIGPTETTPEQRDSYSQGNDIPDGNGRSVTR